MYDLQKWNNALNFNVVKSTGIRTTQGSRQGQEKNSATPLRLPVDTLKTGIIPKQKDNSNISYSTQECLFLDLVRPMFSGAV